MFIINSTKERKINVFIPKMDWNKSNNGRRENGLHATIPEKEISMIKKERMGKVYKL